MRSTNASARVSTAGGLRSESMQRLRAAAADMAEAVRVEVVANVGAANVKAANVGRGCQSRRGGIESGVEDRVERREQ